MSLLTLSLLFLALFYTRPSRVLSLPLGGSLLIIIYVGMIPYSVYTSWKNGGGYKKAMLRKALMSRVAFSLYPGELISREKFTEILASATYRVKITEATDEELIARLFVDSLPGSFRWS